MTVFFSTTPNPSSQEEGTTLGDTSCRGLRWVTPLAGDYAGRHPLQGTTLGDSPNWGSFYFFPLLYFAFTIS